METRKFGRTGFTPSILGFGMMRLKRTKDGKLDEQWAIDNLRWAIDHGLSYVDTAYVYEGSERVTGLCLQDGYRDKVTLATKLPVSRMTCEEDFDRILEEQLQRLQTDHIDAYLLHALSKHSWENYVLKYNVLAHAEKAMQEGKIRSLGFSFHDNLESFRLILNGYDKWDFCQIQLNYLDVNYQAGLQGLKEAHEKGLAVVIMEPLRGGYLAQVPEEAAKLLPSSPVESALDFLWNMEEVNVVLSGMGATEQVQQNMQYAQRAHAGMLTQEELDRMLQAGDIVRHSISIPCTACNYCNICPNDIPIPQIFATMNQLHIDGDYGAASTRYAQLGENNAAKCIRCDACSAQCPQHIAISQELEKIHKRLG